MQGELAAVDGVFSMGMQAEVPAVLLSGWDAPTPSNAGGGKVLQPGAQLGQECRDAHVKLSACVLFF